MPKKNAGFAAASHKQRAKVSWIDPDDAPEITDEMLDRADIHHGGRILRRGRPCLGAAAKTAVTLRLDPDVVASYRATGPGWQTRINDDLRRARKLGKVNA